MPTCSSKFPEVEEYVKNGVPTNHFLRDLIHNADLFPSPISMRRIESGKIWLDEYYDYDYGDFPPKVLYSARFRDGLTADDVIYPSFVVDFHNGHMWVQEYIKHSIVVYNHLSKAHEIISCDDTCHIYTGCMFKTQSAHEGVLCASAINRINFLMYCMNNIDGNHNHADLKRKLFKILWLDVSKLPKRWTKKHRDECFQRKWLHTLQCSLYVLVNQGDLLVHQKYYYHEMFVLDMLNRFKQTLSHLNNDDVFDTPNTCKILVSLLTMLETFHDSSQGEPVILVHDIIEKYGKVVLDLYKKHNGVPAEFSLNK